MWFRGKYVPGFWVDGDGSIVEEEGEVEVFGIGDGDIG